MKNSTIVYILWALSFGFAILALFNDNFGKIAFILPFVALYFADKVKKQEDQKLGNKLMIITIIIFAILLAINALTAISAFSVWMEAAKGFT